MFTQPIRKSAAAVAILAAAGLGGSAIAGAAGSSTASTDRPARVRGEALPSTVAAKVKEAALAKVPGATVLRTEAGGPYPTPYHAHVRTADGTLEVVLVDARYEATAMQADAGRGRGGRVPGGRGPGGIGETPLTGSTRATVEAAVLDVYPGATIERTETNADGSAPYESHVTTKDGKALEVLVSKAFAVVDAREQPARP